MSKPAKMAWADMTDDPEDIVISKRGIKVNKTKPVPTPPTSDKKKPPSNNNENDM